MWVKLRIQRRFPTRAALIAAGLTACALVAFEVRTSCLESRLLAAAARRLTYSVQPGPSPSIHYPRSGPYDVRLGYSRLPDFLDRLDDAGYAVKAQARVSRLSLALTDRGIFPIYREKTQAGLKLLDRGGEPLFSVHYPERAYRNFDDIPPLIVQNLLFIENREILDQRHPYRNPSVEWDRLAKAMVDLGLSKVSPSHRISGGSTLATQIEKIRHSPDGRTSSVWEKFRQMGSASLRAYLDGERTLEARKRIVRDYINSIPLTAVSGYGEVSGLADGLWAWFGEDIQSVNYLLSGKEIGSKNDPLLKQRARAYREILSMLLALKKPSFYLYNDPKALQERVDSFLPLLCEAGIISPPLRDATLKAQAQFLDRAPSSAAVPFSQSKGRDSVRVALLGLLGLDSTYDLDRLDLTVSTTLDGAVQEKVTRELQRLRDPSYAQQAGIVGYRLLNGGDPESVIYSFALYERGQGVNLLRVQADNYNQPLNINEGTKLELGSTAKLRTLVNYLEIVESLHKQYAGMSPEELRSVKTNQDDRLTKWALDYLSTAFDKDKSAAAMLEAAMNRRYSANPGERFFTGGGLHVFSNFDSKDNGRILTVQEAFERSVNLVFIRVMRDIVNYYVFRVPGASPSILEDIDSPARQQYLARFADLEGRQFLSEFYKKYQGLKTDQALHKLVSGIHATPKRLAVIYRAVRPDVGVNGFAAFLIENTLNPHLSDKLIQGLYDEYAPGKFNLSDQGYLARVHPLELWLLAYKAKHPDASLDEVLTASTNERQEVYQWLFKKHKSAQDTRIRVILERDAFKEIHRAWKRQGYPFRSLVPSYATAIGSSGDTPVALAELMGIIANGGVRYPVTRIRELHFAAGTPIDTVVARRHEAGRRVLSTEIASVLRRELIGVVEKGTAQRAAGSVVLSDGTHVELGGKTGTGDNRFETYGTGGHETSSRPINRTATFVFLIGDRFFGTITAYVPGEIAGGYRFTSALPVQIFKHLVPVFAPLFERTHKDSSDTLLAAAPPVPERRNSESKNQASSPSSSSNGSAIEKEKRATVRAGRG